MNQTLQRTRMAIAFLALVAGFSALYLHLYKLGVVGNLTCSTGGCDRAMFSPWGWFLGVDVALIGVIGYSLILIVTIIGLQPRWERAAWAARSLAFLALGGFLFTLRLKYAEFVILRTFCPWCAISAVSITLITALALVGLKARGRSP